jgi:hypothetical protein
MLSSVLRSERAVQVNIAIMRAFVRLRELATSHAELTRKLNALEAKYDVQFKVVFDAIRALMDADVKPRRRIGFKPDEQNPATESHLLWLANCRQSAEITHTGTASASRAFDPLPGGGATRAPE